jgi:hypothetical protein
MYHDLLAELTGYRNELAIATAADDADRSALVQGEIARVSGEIQARVDEFEGAAKQHDADGQDVRGAEARVEARRYRDALDTTPTVTRPDQAQEKAVPAPKETATRRRTTKG